MIRSRTPVPEVLKRPPPAPETGSPSMLATKADATTETPRSPVGDSDRRWRSICLALGIGWFGSAVAVVCEVLGQKGWPFSVIAGSGVVVLAMLLALHWYRPALPRRHRRISDGKAGSLNSAAASIAREQYATTDPPENQLRTIIDTIPALAWSAGPDGGADFFNRRWLDYAGLSAQEAQGWGWTSVIHPEDRNRLTEYWRSILKTGEPGEIEARMRGRDGQCRWFLLRGSPLRDESGKIVKWYGTNTDIDARRRAEGALRASELHFRLIVDHIPGLVCTLTAAGRLDLINRQVLEYLGKTVEALNSGGLRDAIHPDDVPRVVAAWKHSVETGDPCDTEHRIRRADGVYRWFNVRGLPARDAEARITRWYVLFTDIDDRTRAQEALRSRERSIRLIVDSIPGLISTRRADGTVEFINRQTVDFFGPQVEGLADLSPYVHPDDRDRILNDRRRAIETGQPVEHEFRARRADGEYRWVHSRNQPSRDAQGRVIRWYNLVTDIEDRKNMEEALRASEHDLGLMIETMPALAWSASPDGELNYLNRRMLDYIGAYSPDELTQGRWAGLFHPHDRDLAVESWAHSVATGRPWELQSRIRNAAGTYRWFHVVGQLGRDDQGQPTRWYGLLFDIDDRKNMEETLRKTQAQLSRAAQIATVAELSASIAHEVNQPLAAVVANGYACHSWLSAKPPNVERALLTADRVVRDGNAAAAVIQRIRALFRQAPPVKDRLAMNDVIQEVCNLIRDEVHAKGIVLNTDLQSDLPTTLADRVQMQQVIANLARNAIEAMETVMDRPRELLISSRKDGDTIVIDVADCGVGITDTEAVFEPFVTTKQGGMGMGLAICRSIVEAHGGRLWAANKSPCGAVFSLAIPMFGDDLR